MGMAFRHSRNGAGSMTDENGKNKARGIAARFLHHFNGFRPQNGVLTSKMRGLPQKSMVRDSKMHGLWAPYDSPFTAYKLSRFAYS